MSLCVGKPCCGFAPLEKFVFMWQKYDASPFIWLETVIYVSLFFSLQDSMAEACAEGIGDEHYRLEGKDTAHHHHQLISLTLIPFILIWLNENLQTRAPAVSQPFILSPPFHTHFLSPNNVLMRSPFTFPPTFSPPQSLIRPSLCGALQSASIPPCFSPQCDVILD